MGTSLHGLWRLTVHIWARHYMEIMVENAIIILHFWELFNLKIIYMKIGNLVHMYYIVLW